MIQKLNDIYANGNNDDNNDDHGDTRIRVIK